MNSECENGQNSGQVPAYGRDECGSLAAKGKVRFTADFSLQQFLTASSFSISYSENTMRLG